MRTDDNSHAVDVKAKMPNSDETDEGGRDDATVNSDAATQATIA
jgi:hypothetical protein